MNLPNKRTGGGGTTGHHGSLVHCGDSNLATVIMSSTISISQWWLATALVPLSQITMHPSQRTPDQDQVKRIFDELQQGISRQENSKLVLLLPQNWSPDDLRSLINAQTSHSDVLNVPNGVNLICIDGQHRIEAARLHLKALRELNPTTIPPQAASHWWAEIYSGGMC